MNKEERAADQRVDLFTTVLVGFTGAWRDDEERKSLATLPPVRQITTGIGSLMGTLRDGYRGCQAGS